MSILRSAALALGLLAGLCGVRAQAQDPLQGQAFRTMIEAGFTPETVFAFADVAEAAGNPDAAIAALERLLTLRPEESAARARLARLYAEIGNAALAARYGDDDPAPATEIWGAARATLAYETNPAAAPVASQVRIFDGLAAAFIDVPSGVEKDDLRVSLGFDLSLAHPLSDRAVLVAEVGAAADKYREDETLDSIALATTIGPWIALDASDAPAQIRPFISLGATMLDGQPESGLYGGGLSVLMPLGGHRLSAVAEVIRQDYNDAFSPLVDIGTLDNTAGRLGLGLDGPVGAGWTYGLFLSGGYTSAEVAFESFLDLFFSASIGGPIPDAEAVLGRPLRLQLAGSIRHNDYDAPDPALDALTERRDLDVGGAVDLSIALTQDFSLTLGAEYVRSFSNIGFFDTQNLTGFVEIEQRF